MHKSSRCVPRVRCVCACVTHAARGYAANDAVMERARAVTRDGAIERRAQRADESSNADAYIHQHGEHEHAHDLRIDRTYCVYSAYT